MGDTLDIGYKRSAIKYDSKAVANLKAHKDVDMGLKLHTDACNFDACKGEWEKITAAAAKSATCESTHEALDKSVLNFSGPEVCKADKNQVGFRTASKTALEGPRGVPRGPQIKVYKAEKANWMSDSLENSI